MDFVLGALVLPASNGMLSELGHDVRSLGWKAIGVVIEEGSRRCHAHFPELKLSLWVDHDQLKDVQKESAMDSRFKAIWEISQRNLLELPAVFLINRLVLSLKATHVLGVDHGSLSDIWEESADKLAQYSSQDTSLQAMRLSLGLEEFMPNIWENLKKELGQRLLVERFLPSGMHKMELSLYIQHLR